MKMSIGVDLYKTQFTVFVQMVMGILRLQNKTAGYRLVYKYGNTKGNKGTGKSIIATARKMSKVARRYALAV
jgi:hypothetical protein